MNKPESDLDAWTALLVQAQAGDEYAYEKLMREMRPRLTWRALHVVHDETLADEVVTQAFHKAARDLDSFDPTKGRASTWLETIVRNAAIDVSKTRQTVRGREVLGFDVPAAGPDEGKRVEPEDDVEPSPPVEADLPILSELLREALDRLEEEDRRQSPPRRFALVLRLRDLQGRTSREVAAELSKGGQKVTENNVNTLCNRARKRLAEFLDPDALP